MNIIKISKYMENTLIMNKLPLPRYFDGQNWNTKIKPTRKSIPKYLHSDLPELKLQELKEQFKKIGKFNCPKLEYFSSLLNKKNKLTEKKVPKQSLTARHSYHTMKQELQYALLVCDRESQIIDHLVEKAKQIHPSQEKIKHNSKHSSKEIPEQKYFDNTIHLVFRNRKKIYLNELKKDHEKEISPQLKEMVESIKLLDF